MTRHPALARATILALFAWVPGTISAQDDSAPHPWIAAVRRLRLDSLPGNLKVFYSVGHRAHAEAMHAFVTEAMAFYQDSLGATASFTLLLVNKSDWTQAVGPQFWGFASNRAGGPGDDWAIIQPATGDGALADLIGPAESQIAPETWRKLNPGNPLAEQLAQRMIDLVVAHEYGHVLVRSRNVPIRWGRDWFQEFLASYLMYAFLVSRHRDLAEFNDLWDRIVTRVVPEAYT